MWEEMLGQVEQVRPSSRELDYEHLVFSACCTPVNAQMLRYLQDIDVGPALGYFLATHPDEALVMATLPPKK